MTTFEIAADVQSPQVDYAVLVAGQLTEAASPLLPALAVTLALDASIGPDGAFALTKNGDAVTIKGDAEGLRCGLYTLLNVLGFHWHNPAEPIISPVVSAEPDWGRLVGVHRPNFGYRGLHICAGSNHYDETVARWMSFNRMNRKLTHLPEDDIIGADLARLGIRPDATVHAYSLLIPDEKYFAAHPEYFAFVGGKRIRQRDGGQLCLANLEMRAAFVRELTEIIKSKPHISVFGICPNDGYGWCECAGCRALDANADRQDATVNGRVADFVEDICRRMATVAPQTQLGHYSYSNFADFPDFISSPPANLLAPFTQFHCYRHPMTDRACPTNGPIGARMERFTAHGFRLYIYDYYAYRWGEMPAPFWRTQRADFAAWKDLRAEGFLSEAGGAGSPEWRSFWPSFYLAARLLWDSGETADGLISEFCDARYAAAAPTMAEYFRTLADGFDALPGCFVKSPADFAAFFTAELQERAGRLLSDAVRIAPDNALVAAEAKLFASWKDNYAERSRYTTDPAITPYPLSADVAATEPQRIYLVDRETQLPNLNNDTRAWIFADADTIRIHLALIESRMDSLSVVESIYGGDSVEIFLSDAVNPDKCYQFLIAPDGRFRANEAEGSRWNWSWIHDAKVQVSRGANGWKVDMVIPKRSINAGNDFSFSVIRNRYAGGTWEVLGAPSGGAFFNPSRYVRIIQ